MMTTTIKTETPKIYVACLSSYVNGYLHGAWIDCDQEIDDVNQEIQEMLKSSPMVDAEEYAIHDYDNFGSIRLGEYESLETVLEVASLIIEHGQDKATGIIEHYSVNYLDDAKKALEENYLGHYDSIKEFAEEWFTQCNEIPDHLQGYIDYDRIAYDYEVCGDFIFIKDSNSYYHIFLAH